MPRFPGIYDYVEVVTGSQRSSHAIHLFRQETGVEVEVVVVQDFVADSVTSGDNS